MLRCLNLKPYDQKNAKVNNLEPEINRRDNQIKTPNSKVNDLEKAVSGFQENIGQLSKS